jgi:hydrogenase maturation factor
MRRDRRLPAAQLRRCQGIADRAQVVELELVRGEPREQAGDHVLVHSRFASPPLDEIAQVELAAMKLFRLSSQLGKFTARRRRLVTKSCDLDLLLAGLSTKPSKLPLDRGRILRHKLKARRRPPLALRNGGRAGAGPAIVRARALAAPLVGRQSQKERAVSAAHNRASKRS